MKYIRVYCNRSRALRFLLPFSLLFAGLGPYTGQNIAEFLNLLLNFKIGDGLNAIVLDDGLLTLLIGVVKTLIIIPIHD